MSSTATDTVKRSAAWRLSLWATLAFALGTLLVFAGLHQFVAKDIQRRSDAWLSGEVEVLGDVAERTPKDFLYSRVVKEVAELASREVPNRTSSGKAENDSVFFLQAEANGPPRLWVGSGDGASTLAAIRSTKVLTDVPRDVKIKGARVPYRVAAVRVDDGSDIYLGLSELDQMRVLRNLRLRFAEIWLLTVFLGFVIVFYATWKMLAYVRKITEAASRIGQSDLSRRVPNTGAKDEIGQLAHTLNRMLDRIENSVHQLHTITDSLAHDLRSPMTAIRGRLETSLSGLDVDQAEPIVSAIEELDRLAEFLNTSLDLAEAKADALRLTLTRIDMDHLVRDMVDLYEPFMNERGLKVEVHSSGPCFMTGDSSLLHRVMANLFDNEIKHLPPSCTVWIKLHAENQQIALSIEDDGPGFDPAIQRNLFQQRMKGPGSTGHGLGLAFVQAVVRVHGGDVSAQNRHPGGARLILTLPADTTSSLAATAAGAVVA